MKRYFVTGIHTGIGKTVVSAILVEALNADYWKPIQSGSKTESDTGEVMKLVSNTVSNSHPEIYRLSKPISPHAAAETDKITIDLNKIILPATNNNLIIEGAGGLMVPLNKDKLIIDLIRQLGAEVVLVSKNYLGSINHTLLSVEALKNRNIPVKGIVFNGESNISSEKYILDYTGLNCIGRVYKEKNIDKDVVRKYAVEFKNML